MAQCIVIADDLTGANATGVLLRKMDYRTYTIMESSRMRDPEIASCDCMIYSTDSRGIDRETAYRRVFEAVSLCRDERVRVFGKRIDSTMRGNIGSETDAFLDALGEDVIAVSAPCFPESGRIVAGGYMLVNGRMLHLSEAAADPKKPVHISNIGRIFEQQSKYRVGSIFMDDMMDGKDHLAAKMRTLADEGCRIITVDCVTQEDLDLIADGLISSGLKFITVDPGVFTAAVAGKMLQRPDRSGRGRILAVIGSVNPVTKAQMEELWKHCPEVRNIFVKIMELVRSDESREREIKRVSAEAAASASSCEVISITGEGLYPEHRIDLNEFTDSSTNVEALSERINASFAEIAARIFGECRVFQGIYSSGGDITEAICRRFGTSAICLHDEVLPLAAYGQFSTGSFAGLHIITKGGMVGNRDAAERCISYLKEKLPEPGQSSIRRESEQYE